MCLWKCEALCRALWLSSVPMEHSWTRCRITRPQLMHCISSMPLYSTTHTRWPLHSEWDPTQSRYHNWQMKASSAFHTRDINIRLQWPQLKTDDAVWDKPFFSLFNFASYYRGPSCKEELDQKKGVCVLVRVCMQVELCVCACVCVSTSVRTQVYKCAVAAVPTDWRLF